ncbi:hypothetical protein LK533_15020 [Sphingomonas sp. PL-96]|uniref:hypothetical protein n=1 Tax=Sphingomonas sp. PL-96 TaxID=2887201 RepID=UPI001E2AF75E|nr:hypothetical protein [Sphingomonas sp. PL-96]MCC2977976.1 hypothetical protein [Sphingomonas sp. PL-96]
MAIMPALFGVSGVVLGRCIAQSVRREGEERVTSRTSIALTALFGMAMVAISAYMQLTPFHALGVGAAAGFIGLGPLEFIAEQFSERLRGAIDGFFNPRK